MAWQLATPGELPELVAFLKHKEWGHVGYTSRLRRKGKAAFPGTSSVRLYINRRQSPVQEIIESVLVTKSGLVIPVLNSTNAAASPRTDLRPILENRRLHSIMGVSDDVRAIEAIVTPTPRASVDYYSMVYTQPDSVAGNGAAPVDAPETRFHRAQPRDAFQLYPLQREYEKEEVLIDPTRFNSHVCYYLLQKTLKNEVVYYASIKKRPAAKAGTNARGFGYAQIGGVYTVRQYRRHGIGGQLMYVLIRHLLSAHFTPCLFVKCTNTAAQSLYRKTGFAHAGDFRIVYYGDD